jgi:RimJ/RimL family protein N-acetyltransferase
MMVPTTSLTPSSAGVLAHRVRLCDGTAIDVRPIRLDDGERLRCFHARLSSTTILLRYFHIMPILSDDLVASFTHVDFVDRMAVVATIGADDATAAAQQEIVGLVNYARIAADTAEVAFVVADAWQGKGVATMLLYDLAAYAHACGFRHLLAITLRRNLRMLNLLRRCGFPCTLHVRAEDDEVDAWLDIAAAPTCRLAPLAR